MNSRQNKFQKHLETIMKEVSELQLIELILLEVNNNYDVISKYNAIESDIYHILSTINIYNNDILDKVKDRIDKIISVEELLKPHINLLNEYQKCRSEIELIKRTSVNENDILDKITNIINVTISIEKLLKPHTNLLNEYQKYRSEIELIKKTSVNKNDYEERINALVALSSKIDNLINRINQINAKYSNRNNKDIILFNIAKGINDFKASVVYDTLQNVNSHIKNFDVQITSLEKIFNEEKNKIDILLMSIKNDNTLWKEDSRVVEKEIKLILKNFEKSSYGLKYCQNLYTRLKNNSRKADDIKILKDKYKWLARNKYKNDIEFIINSKISKREAEEMINEIKKNRGLLTCLYELLFY